MLKYNYKDTEKMINVFAALAKNKIIQLKLAMRQLSFSIIQYLFFRNFSNAWKFLEKYDENYIKENYMGVIGYVTLRINLVEA